MSWAEFFRPLPVLGTVLLFSTALNHFVNGDRLVGYAGCIAGSLVCAALFTQRVRMKFSIVDRRISAILTTIMLSVAATIVVYGLGFGHKPDTFFGAVFAGWVGSVAFFALVGGSVAVVSLERPEESSFDARARILFRRQKGLHIEYMLSNLPNIMEHFSEETLNKIQILDYCNGSKKYRLAWATVIRVRSYIDDVDTTYSSCIKFRDVTSAPTGKIKNRLVHIRVADALAHGMENFDSDAISREFLVPIGQNQTVEIKTRVEGWVAVHEVNDHTPSRYTKKLKFTIDNQLPGFDSVPISFRRLGGEEWETKKLRQSDLLVFCEAQELKPGETVYEYKLGEPAKNAEKPGLQVRQQTVYEANDNPEGLPYDAH